MSTTRRVFPETFKREAVDRVASSGLSATPIKNIAEPFGFKRVVEEQIEKYGDAGRSLSGGSRATST